MTSDSASSGTSSQTTTQTTTSTLSTAVNCSDATAMAALLQRLNAWRASGPSCGGVAQAAASALAWNGALAAAAQRQAADMAATGQITHTGSDGSTVADRVTAAGYRYSVVAENVAAGVPQVEQALGLWMDSAGHCTNMADARMMEVGAACVVNATGGYGTYWTLVLARPAS